MQLACFALSWKSASLLLLQIVDCLCNLADKCIDSYCRVGGMATNKVSVVVGVALAVPIDL